LNEYDKSILLLLPMKAGEDNPRAWEEEAKLSLLRLECNSSLAGIPGMWGLEFRGKGTTFIRANHVGEW